MKSVFMTLLLKYTLINILQYCGPTSFKFTKYYLTIKEYVMKCHVENIVQQNNRCECD